MQKTTYGRWLGLGLALLSVSYLAWSDESLTIVPMPRELKFTGENWQIKNGTNEPGVLLITARVPEASCQIGAERLAARLRALGCGKLGVIREHEVMTNLPNAYKIYIGIPETHGLLARQIRSQGLKVTAADPGAQGYVIGFGKDAEQRPCAVLGGSDPVGALYACVTMEHLLDTQGTQVVARCAQVRDWPDFKVRFGMHIWCKTGDSLLDYARAGKEAEFEKAAAETFKMHADQIDWMLRYKLNATDLVIMQEMHTADIPPQVRRLVRRVNDYAAERGFYAVCGAPYTIAMPPQSRLGKASLREDAKKKEIKCAGRRKGDRYFLFCWSEDDLVLDSARETGRYLRDTGIKYAVLHATDTGGYFDPEGWSQRCEKCRQKWGDDFAKASSHAFSLFVKGIREQAPEAIPILIQYPYVINACTDKGALNAAVSQYGPVGAEQRAHELQTNLFRYWKELAQATPPDVPLCIRESPPENVRVFREIVKPHPLYVYYEPSIEWPVPFTTFLRLLKSVYGDPRDVAYLAGGSKLVRTPIGLIFAEFAWNTSAEGSAYWDNAKDARHSGYYRGPEFGNGPQDLIDRLSLRIANCIYGPNAGPLMAEAIKQNVCDSYILDPGNVFVKGSGLEHDIPLMKDQWERAQRACDAIDKVWTTFSKERPWKAAGPIFGLTDGRFEKYSQPFWYDVMFYRMYLHGLKHIAGARYCLWQAETLLMAGKEKEGKELAAKGLKLLDALGPDMAAVAKDEEKEPLLLSGSGGSVDYIYKYYYAPAGEAIRKDLMLLETRKAEDLNKGRLAVPERLQSLFASGTVYAVRTDALISLDGELKETAWQKASVIENFRLYPDKALLVSPQDTRVRILYDDKNIYFGIECFTAISTQKVAGGKCRLYTYDGKDKNVWGNQDNLEIFLDTNLDKQNYYHIAVSLVPEVSDFRCGPKYQPPRDKTLNSGATVACKDLGDRQVMELQLPLSALEARAQVGGTWGLLLNRQIADAGGSGKPSLVTTADLSEGNGFHSPWLFGQLAFVEAGGFPQRTCKAEIKAVDLKAEDKTLTDRVATVVSFKPAIEANRFLHNVKIKSAVYAPDGKQIAAGGELAVASVPYNWQSDKTVDLTLDTTRPTYTLKIEMTSDETGPVQWSTEKK